MPRELEIVTTIYGRPSQSRPDNNEKEKPSKTSTSRHKSPAFQDEARQLMSEMQDLQAKLGYVDRDIVSTYSSNCMPAKRQRKPPSSTSIPRRNEVTRRSPEKKSSHKEILERPQATSKQKIHQKEENQEEHWRTNVKRLLNRLDYDHEKQFLYQHLYGLHLKSPRGVGTSRSRSLDKLEGVTEQALSQAAPLRHTAHPSKTPQIAQITQGNEREIRTQSNTTKFAAVDAQPRPPANDPQLTLSQETAMGTRRRSSTSSSAGATEARARTEAETQGQLFNEAESTELEPGSISKGKVVMGGSDSQAPPELIHERDDGAEEVGKLEIQSNEPNALWRSSLLIPVPNEVQPVEPQAEDGLQEASAPKDATFQATPTLSYVCEGENAKTTQQDVTTEPGFSVQTIVKDNGGSKAPEQELLVPFIEQQNKKKVCQEKKRHYDVQQVREFMRSRQIEQRLKQQELKTAQQNALLRKQARLKELETYAKVLLHEPEKPKKSKNARSFPTQKTQSSLDWGPRPHILDSEAKGTNGSLETTWLRHIPVRKVDHAVQTLECSHIPIIRSSRETQTPFPRHSATSSPISTTAPASQTSSGAQNEDLGSLMQQIQDLDRLISSVLENPSNPSPIPQANVQNPFTVPTDHVDAQRLLLDMTASTKYKEMPSNLFGLIGTSSVGTKEGSQGSQSRKMKEVPRRDEQTQTSQHRNGRNSQNDVRGSSKASFKARIESSTPQKSQFQFFREEVENRPSLSEVSPLATPPASSFRSPIVHKSPYNIMTALRNKLLPFEKSDNVDASVSQGPLSSANSERSANDDDREEFLDLEADYTSFDTLRSSGSPGESSVDTIVTSCRLQASFGSRSHAPNSPPSPQKMIPVEIPILEEFREQNVSESTLEQIASVEEDILMSSINVSEAISKISEAGNQQDLTQERKDSTPSPQMESVSIQFPSLGKSRSWEAAPVVTEQSKPSVEPLPSRPFQLAPTSLFMRLKAELNRGEGLDNVLKGLTELERLQNAFSSGETVKKPNDPPKDRENGREVYQLEQKMETMQRTLEQKLESFKQGLLSQPPENSNSKGKEAAAAAQQSIQELQTLTEKESISESLPPVSDSGEALSDGESWTRKRRRRTRQTDTSGSSVGTGMGADSSDLSQLPQAVEILLAEEARQQRLLLKLREKSRVERTLDELELLQTQKRILRAQGETEKAVSVKKRQRGLLMKLHEERVEIERLRQTHKKEMEQRLRRLQKAQQGCSGAKPRFWKESNSFSSSWETDSSVASVPPPLVVGKACSPAESVKSEAVITEGISENSESITEAVNEEIPTNSVISLPERKLSDSLPSHVSPVNISCSTKPQVKLKSPLSPRPSPHAFKTRSRNRHSSGSDESVTFSQADTLSDASDVEGRVLALAEELKRRQAEADKLKQDQKKAKREQLKAQEISLLKQIEAYDKLINDVKHDLGETADKVIGVAVKPQIKRPTGKTRSQSKEISEIVEDVSNATSVSENLSESVTVTEESAIYALESNSAPIESKIPAVESSASNIELKVSPLESPISQVESKVPLESSTSSVESKVPEETPLVLECILPIEVLKLSSEGSNLLSEVLESLESQPSVGEDVESSTLTQSSSEATLDATVGNLWADSFAESLLQTILRESVSSIFAIRTRNRRSQCQSDKYSSDVTRQVLQRVSALLEAQQSQENQQVSPKSKASPYTMTYDVISPDWSPPLRSPRSPPASQEWFDDDLGFSTPPPLSQAARLEAQKIEKEKQRIEEEIQQLVNQVSPPSSAPFYREIPNKPPPPYTPPGTWTTPPSAKSVSKVGIFQSKSKVVDFCFQCFEQLIFEWKNCKIVTANFDEKLRVKILGKEEEKDEEKLDLIASYYHFLFDLTKHLLLEIGARVTWLPPLSGYSSKWRAREVLNCQEQLWKVVEQQLLFELHYNPRYSKPSRTLKWCHKKRDRVDEVLVQELQAEEREWTDFVLDEQLVKEQTFEIIWNQLMNETAQWVDQLWGQRVLKFVL